MKKIVVISFLISAFLVNNAYAQNTDSPPEPEASANARIEIGLEQDANFGFYPTVRAVMPISEQLEIGGYGNYYTNQNFSASNGSGLWTEFGILTNYIPFRTEKQSLSLSMNLGLSNGNVLSGDSIAHFAEGLASNLNILYNYHKFELLASGSYYHPFKQRGPLANSFYFYSVSAGYFLSKNLALGLHYEFNALNLLQLNQRIVGIEWLGSYVQLAINQKHALRFTGGWDVAENGINSFYKLSLNLTID